MWTRMSSCLPCQFNPNDRNVSSCHCQCCCAPESRNHRRLSTVNCDVLCMHFLLHCIGILCTHMIIPFRDQLDPFRRSLEIAGLHRQQCTHPLAVLKKLPSAAPPGPMYGGNVFTAAPVSKFIITPLNQLWTAHRSQIKTSQRE